MPRALEPLFLVEVSGLVLLLFVFDTPTLVRAPLVIGYLVVCPGFAFTRLMGFPERWMDIAFAVPLSLAISALSAMAAVYARVWSPELVFVFVLFITLVTVGVDAVRQERSGLPVK